MLTFGEETGLTTYAVDPGDMRTPMHQDAFPGEDISDRPTPESVVPHLLALLEQRLPIGPLPRGRDRHGGAGMTTRLDEQPTVTFPDPDDATAPRPGGVARPRPRRGAPAGRPSRATCGTAIFRDLADELAPATWWW